MKTVTDKDINQFITINGGFALQQVRFAQQLTGNNHWKKALTGKTISDDEWNKFVNLAGTLKQKKIKLKKAKPQKAIINSVSKPDGWHWKPPEPPPVKRESKNNKNQGRKAAKRELISKLDPKAFYLSDEWRMLRVRVLEKYECKCMMCGRSPQRHGIVIHVDHIKPRSRYPELSLEFTNLQLLCEDCNIGKSNKYDTDWRPDGNEEDWQLLDNLPVTMQ